MSNSLLSKTIKITILLILINFLLLLAFSSSIVYRLLTYNITDQQSWIRTSKEENGMVFGEINIIVKEIKEYSNHYQLYASISGKNEEAIIILSKQECAANELCIPFLDQFSSKTETKYFDNKNILQFLEQNRYINVNILIKNNKIQSLYYCYLNNEKNSECAAFNLLLENILVNNDVNKLYFTNELKNVFIFDN